MYLSNINIFEKNKNFAFKINSKTRDFLHQFIITKLKLFHYPNEEQIIEVINLMFKIIKEQEGGWVYIKNINELDEDGFDVFAWDRPTANPKVIYEFYNYIIIDVNDIIRQEKLKDI